MVDPNKLVRRNIAALAPYSTARDDYKGSTGIFLDANENPFENGCNRYPDPRQKALKQRLSRIKDVPADRIFIGNGSDEAIDLCFRIFCEPGKDSAVAISPSYGMYRVASDINDVKVKEVLLNEDFSLPVERLLAAADATTKLMFVCSPNNPTANAFSREDIIRLLEGFGGMLIVDEAYIDFSSTRSVMDLLDRYPNLIILQTLSKAWGMAGLRLGLGFMNPAVARLFSMVKYPYNISSLTQAKVLEMLADENRVLEQVQEIVEERLRVAGALDKMACVRKVYPSDANFLLVKVDDPKGLYGALVADGIIVRDRSTCPLCEGCLRITVGTREENDRMLETVSRWKNCL